MTHITVTHARKDLYKLIDQVAETHEPVVITGKRTSSVLISAEDFAAIQETLYLQSIPGMPQSILEGSKTPVEKCTPLSEFKWPDTKSS